MKQKNSAAPRDPAGARWNPYIIGAAIGILSWMAFAVVNSPIGVSTSLSSAASLCAAPLIGSDTVARNGYWTKFPLKWDYQTLFLLGTFLGSLLSTLASRTFRWETVPATWAHRFGNTSGKRFLAAFIGGLIIMFGARMAGGCTSGHGISGSLQLALSGWVFFLTLFAVGLLTAMALFRSNKNNNTQP